jgi:protoporphyrinogen oxidase
LRAALPGCYSDSSKGGIFMGYVGARGNFESAKSKTDDPAIQELAEGLRQLARAIEDDLNKLEREIRTAASRVH